MIIFTYNIKNLIQMKTKENSNLRKNLAEKVENVKMYYLSGNTIKDTALEFGVSTATMTRFLKDHGISKGKRSFSNPDTVKEIRKKIEELLPNNTITHICKELGINHSQYSKIMGLDINNKVISNSIDSSIVSLENPTFCYLLGLFISDGHIDNDKIYICQSDIAFLKKLQSLIGHTGNLNKATNAENPCYKLTLTDAALRNFLESYNIDSNKKLTAPYIDCGNHTKHFIRGLFDGDGCLSYTYTSGSFRMKNFNITSGSKEVIEGVAKFLDSYNISYTIVEAESKNIYYGINVGTFDDIVKLMHILYDDSGEAKLDKKYIKFVKFEKLIKMNQEVNEIVGSKLKDLE